MAKVDFPDNAGFFFNHALYAHNAEAKKTNEKGSVKETRKALFSDLLEKSGRELETEAPRELSPSEDALKELLDGVHSTGDALKNRPFPEEIKQYKKAVRDFLHYVVENGYTVEAQISGVSQFKRKKFTLVQIVDRKLEQLAAAILTGQSSQMDILARVEEINGLLVNLLQ
jgi:uncharacterized protein YaaR (DUF327 family)